MSRADEIVVGLGATSQMTAGYMGMPYNPESFWAAWPYGGKSLTGYLHYLTSLQNRITNVHGEPGPDTWKYKNLSRLECVTNYVRWFDTGSSNLLLISSGDILDSAADNSNTNSSLLAFNWLASSWDSFATFGTSWPCQNTNNFSCLYPSTWEGDAEKVANWNIYGYKVDYCLSKQLDITNKCRVEFNKNIMISRYVSTLSVLDS